MEAKEPQAKLLESEEEQEKIIKFLEERLEKHDENRKTVQDKLHEICERLKAQISELENRINKELEEKFVSEDDRLQAVLSKLRGDRTATALQKAKAELLVEQSYEIIENKKAKLDFETLCELKAERRIVPELIETKKPINIRVTGVNRGCISVQFTCLNPDEEKILSYKDIVNPARYKCSFFKKDNEQESKEYSLHKNESDNSSFAFTPDTLEAETTYGIRVKIVLDSDEREWSEVAEFTPEFKGCCVWKKCPGYVGYNKKYIVNGGNPRVATKIDNDGDDDNSYWCTIVGNTSIPPDKVTSWTIKILESKKNDGGGIFIGIAPNDINQKTVNYNKCGWYFHCYDSVLWSGLPHKYSGKKFGPRKGSSGQYVHTGDSVGVVVDTTKGDLSFVLNNVNLGVAYCGIPFDKPLVPCVLLYYQGDSVELGLSEVKETEVDSSIPAPSNIIAKRGATWDSITLTWCEVNNASSYQIEVDGNKSWDATTTSTFTKRGLLAETEHSFRLRAVRGSLVSGWSDVVKGRTSKESFETSGWKECPGGVDDYSKYSVDEEESRVATNANYDGSCTIIGNTHIPLNTVTSWCVKILKSKNNDGDRIYVGIAPNDIDQNDFNIIKCGWYFDCYSSVLYSGPPHNYRYPGKAYGPRKEGGGQYVHTGESVGVVMDTTKGELSFVLDGVNYGVAYEGIPLDKPLVPCVILRKYGDSVELMI